MYITTSIILLINYLLSSLLSMTAENISRWLLCRCAVECFNDILKLCFVAFIFLSSGCLCFLSLYIAAANLQALFTLCSPVAVVLSWHDSNPFRYFAHSVKSFYVLSHCNVFGPIFLSHFSVPPAITYMLSQNWCSGNWLAMLATGSGLDRNKSALTIVFFNSVHFQHYTIL